MKRVAVAAVLVTLWMCNSAIGIEKEAFQIRNDYELPALQDCFLQYYYYVPCPTYAWFWGFYDWRYGDIIGQLFTIGDLSMGGYPPCDSLNCHHIVGVRVLDFADYSQAYPGLHSIRFNIYCADEEGRPLGPALWSSAPVDPVSDWYVVPVDPGVVITDCCIHTGPPQGSPRVLVTATHIGLNCIYPQWGLDNISAVVDEACQAHESGCLPALYPRPYVSHYPLMHSGYYGRDFEFLPPLWFADGDDTTEDATQYGYIELAWRLYIACQGPSIEPTTWGSVKALFR